MPTHSRRQATTLGSAKRYDRRAGAAVSVRARQTAWGHAWRVRWPLTGILVTATCIGIGLNFWMMRCGPDWLAGALTGMYAPLCSVPERGALLRPAA